MHSAVAELEMPIRPPVATEMDLMRARQIVRALAPLKRLKGDDADIVVRTIAQIRAEGRKQGFDIAKELLDAQEPCHQSARFDGDMLSRKAE
jgi:hypothetical protein